MTMTLRRAAMTLVAAGIALSLTACGGGGSGADDSAGSDDQPAASGEAITVVAKEFEFDPATLTLAAGADNEVVLANQGVVEHDFTVDDPEVKIHANPGEETAGTVNLPAGSYTVYCSIPGHRQSGMEATLTVE